MNIVRPTFRQAMQKLLILIMVLVLFVVLIPASGCTPKNTVSAPDVPSEVTDIICSPTAEQVAAWTQEILSGSDLLSFLKLLPQTAAIMAIVNGAKAGIKVLEQARQGICTRLADIEQAKADIQSAQTTAAMKYGYKRKL
ncbi:MAG: hypothetical protein ACYC6G_20165 [Desulfobaccales bacterium]